MAVRSFKDIYDLIKALVQQSVPTADFSEGSFDDLYSGAYSLAYQELQTLILDEIGMTFIHNPRTVGDVLNKVAFDRFQISRPEATKALGQITVTRGSGNTSVIKIDPATTRFMVGEIEFIPRAAVTILAGSNSAVISLIAAEGGVEGNIPQNSVWTTELSEVTVSNSQEFQGGAIPLNDSQFKDYISNTVSSLKDGTKEGLEGAAKIIPGVGDSVLVKRLVPVGTLKADGTLQTGSDLFLFNTVRMIMYVSGLSGSVNNEVFAEVKRNVENQLTEGEFITYEKAVTKTVNWTAALTFASTNEALALSQKRSELEQAFENEINLLSIGDDFNRSVIEASLIARNGWTGLFSISTSLPAGDVTIEANEKAVAGTITISIQ